MSHKMQLGYKHYKGIFIYDKHKRPIAVLDTDESGEPFIVLNNDYDAKFVYDDFDYEVDNDGILWEDKGVLS